MKKSSSGDLRRTLLILLDSSGGLVRIRPHSPFPEIIRRRVSMIFYSENHGNNAIGSVYLIKPYGFIESN